MNKPFSFRVLVQDTASRARAGVMHTPHGTIHTPAFMPVATRASVRALSPSEVEEIGIEILIANAYHLAIQPGEAVVASAGGLHQFMGWRRPIVTDSGGFQIFSLSGSRVSDEGVSFSSERDGSRRFLTPEESIRIQEALAADIIMAFDYCPRIWNDPAEVERSVSTTVRWAQRCRAAHRALQQELFGILQGGIFPHLRARCAEELETIGFNGYGIGGLGIGEPFDDTLATVRACVEALPQERVRYLMGIGEPLQILALIAEGVDLFDCALPTRVARHGCALTGRGRVVVKSARYAVDLRPPTENCPCFVCRTWSRAYLRHLFHAREILALRLVSYHNLFFISRILKRARHAIVDGSFPALRASVTAEYNSGLDNEAP